MTASNGSPQISARLREENARNFYPVAERFVDAALRHDDSLFTPGRPIWTYAGLNEIYERLMLNLDTSSGSFMSKFEQQLAGALAEVYQLAAEVIYMHVLFAYRTSITGAKKRALVNAVLSWSPTPVSMPEELDKALSDGLAKMGVAFGTYRHFQVGFLLEFARSWKELSRPEQDRLLADPWAFKQMLCSLPIHAAYAQREALLHIVHPDTFEATVSRDHKQRIAKAFAKYVTSATEDVDRQLQQIRQKLTPEQGNGFNFYEEGLRRIWIGQYQETPEPDQETVVEAPTTPILNSVGHVFICYARQDEQFAQELAAQLQQRGIKIWIDQSDLDYGIDWDRAIDDALYECKALLIVLSPAAVQSDEVRSELRVVLNQRKKIVPVLYQDCRIPRQLLQRQYADFRAHGPDDAMALQRLVRALRF
jgi:hypothetical protein